MLHFIIVIWVGFLGFVLRWGRKEITRTPPHFPWLNHVPIMLQTKNVVRKYTSIFSVRNYNFWYQGPLNFADVSIFLQKNQHFLEKIVSLLKAIV